MSWLPDTPGVHRALDWFDRLVAATIVALIVFGFVLGFTGANP